MASPSDMIGVPTPCVQVGTEDPRFMYRVEILYEMRYIAAKLRGYEVIRVDREGIIIDAEWFEKIQSSPKKRARRMGADQRVVYEGRLAVLAEEYTRRFPDWKLEDLEVDHFVMY